MSLRLRRNPPFRTFVALAIATFGLSIICCPKNAGAQSNSVELTPSPENARVYFVDLRPGQKLRSGTVIHFGLTRMGVAPAGTEKAATGHHHLLIDEATREKLVEGEPIPSDDKHIHFGNGQTEYELRLPPGRHTLRLVLGDAGHVPHHPTVVSKAIDIVVLSDKRMKPRRKPMPAPRPAK